MRFGFLVFIFCCHFFLNSYEPKGPLKKIGCVVACHNRPEYLSKTLDSLKFIQIPKNCFLNIILIDDKSVDEETLRLVEQFQIANENIKVDKIFLKKNAGIATVLNIGFRYLLHKYESDFFSNLDSDVISNPLWLSKLVDLEKSFSQIALKDRPVIYTAYNSVHHPIDFQFQNYAIKRSLGGMSIFFPKKLFPLVQCALRNKEEWDWELVWLVNRKSGYLVTTIPSYLQHIGHYGLHNQGGVGIDEALDFKEF